MSNENETDFWAHVKAEAEAAVKADPPAPASAPAVAAVGCSCAPEPGRESLCAWCAMSEAERERLRNVKT